MANRKTIEVGKLIDMANAFLRNSDDDQREKREGVCSFIESIIHTTGNYSAGYSHLPSAGLAHDPTFNEAWDRYRAIVEILKANDMTDSLAVIRHPEWSDYCKDDTRRQYGKPANLREDANA